ncbi:hypothetical protein HYV82_04455 [Candidatus Woesearchaeota archaeon]|nr:hypothetical protein [Candidatus Woesearchaeota archaeon]
MGIPNFGRLTAQLFGNVARTEHLLLQEFKVNTGDKLTKKTKFDILKDTGIVIMGMKRGKEKRYSINIGLKAKVKPGSMLAMGTNTQLNEFERYAGK